MSTARLRKTPTMIEELIVSSRAGWFELVDGKLERIQMSPFTSRVAIRLSSRLQYYCEERQAGEVYDAEVYYRCFANPKTSRKPDISFISKSRLPADADDVGYFSVAPDLAVEVVSPRDRADRVQQKILEYRAAAIRLIWVIYPQSRFAAIYYHGRYEEVDENGDLDGRDVLPGFRARLGELLLPRSTA